MDIRFDRYVDAGGKEQSLDHAYVINKLLAMPKAYDSVVASMYILDHYESYYRINSHQAGARKDIMPLIAYAQAEDTWESSYLRERMTRYRRSGVLATFGLSWTEFVKLPKSYCDSLMEEAEFAIKEKATDMESEMSRIMASKHG
jgi:replicative superfamily II helicase